MPGEGHTHVWIDGRLLTMSYEPDVALGDLEPGMHHIEVTLAANDHSDYMIDGEIVGAGTMLEIAGEVEPADTVVDVSYRDGDVETATIDVGTATGSIVEVVVTSDVAEKVHVHGYDISTEVGAGETARLRFTADIPGIFEVELEESGKLLFELTVS